MSRSLFYAVSIVLGLIVGTIVMLASSPARSFGLEQEHVEEASTSVLAPQFRSAQIAERRCSTSAAQCSDRWLVRGPPRAANRGHPPP